MKPMRFYQARFVLSNSHLILHRKKLNNCNEEDDMLLVVANHIDNKQSLLYLMSLYQPSLTAFLSYFSNHILFYNRKKI